MAWALVWTVLILGAGAVLFVLGRRLWRQAKSISAELAAVSDRLAEAADHLAGPGHLGGPS